MRSSRPVSRSYAFEHQHFLLEGAEDFGKAGVLGYLEFRVTEYPVTLNLRQADASDQLYHARKRAISSFFQASGVDISILEIVDGLPGGGGMQSPNVLAAITPAPAGGENYTTIKSISN